MSYQKGSENNPPKILFISHEKTKCGVYEFGKDITEALSKSNRYSCIRVECSSISDLKNAISTHFPIAIIYNYMPTVMPWVSNHIAPLLYKNNIATIDIPQIGIIHDVTQYIADTATNYRNKYIFCSGKKLINSLFDFYICADPTLLLLNPIVYKTGRLIPKYNNKHDITNSIPIIGSFGFGTPNKGFENIVTLVQKEYDEAIIRFNIPSSDFADKEGYNARTIESNCNSLIYKSGIKLTVTHEFFDKKELLDFLAKNTINVFLYSDNRQRGLSSTIDNAMAVKRPIAISDSIMFRHLFDVTPSICIKNNSLKTIISNGFAPLQAKFDEWSEENLTWEYERIIDSALSKYYNANINISSYFLKIKKYINKITLSPPKSFSWLRSTNNSKCDDVKLPGANEYTPINLPPGAPLNCILDNKARNIYKSAIEKLFELAPITMSKKIPDANVQQGFVFDTVFRYLKLNRNAKLLCVGSYEDTASMSIKKLGYRVEEIDPVLNYSLQEFITKPTTIKNSYDIIFSTSVIEHVQDDEYFVYCISELLNKGGIAVITCDYNDFWKPGDPVPECNKRFYTKKDLLYRILPSMKNCELVDIPMWDCLNPDFKLSEKYVYTFASLVVIKR